MKCEQQLKKGQEVDAMYAIDNIVNNYYENDGNGQKIKEAQFRHNKNEMLF